MKNNVSIWFKFALFFALGVAILSFIGLGYMIIESYEFWDVFWTALTFVVSSVASYYLIKKFR